jgi:hypothetical protein
MMRLRLVLSAGLGAALLLAPLRTGAQSNDPDEERSAWRFKRSVDLPGSAAAAPSFAALALPPELGARCQPQLEDVRLLAADGHEVQYVVDRALERETGTVAGGRLVDTRSEKKERTVWVVDLGETRAFDTIILDIRQQDFVKRILVEASDDDRSWKTLRTDAGVFDRPWATRVHHTSIAFPEQISARYLRLTADDRRSKPIEVQGVSVSASRRMPAETWRRPVAPRAVGKSGEVSRYRLELPPGFPLELLELSSDDPAFFRRVVLHEVRDVNGQRQEASLGDAWLYKLRIEDEALSGESLALRVQRSQGGELLLSIHDGDGPPLRNLRVVASAPATRLLFPALAGPLTLYYGNEATRAPVYDLQTLWWRIGLAPSYAATTLGPEAENPRYRKAPPLPFAAPRGAPLEVARWKAARPLAVSGREDLYTVTLAGEDLGLLRDDLGDVRIVDDEGRQVPYVLDGSASEARVPLAVAKEAATSSDGRATTRWRLGVAAASGSPLPLPLAAVELTFLDVFFTRPARLLAPPPPELRGRERVLFSGTLTASANRQGRRASLVPATVGVATDRAPIVLTLDGQRQSELFLEIGEGDNVPLTLAQAQAVVRVPRLAFKAAPGTYRILLGNPSASAPRYDIASLRQEILSYSALPLQAGASAPNPAFRRRAADYFKNAPPTLLLWGTLLLAVAALLFLTARILRQPAS